MEQIIRDLVESAISQTREKMRKEVQAAAELAAENRVVEEIAGKDAREETRKSFRQRLRTGELDAKNIEIDVTDNSSGLPTFDIPGMPGSQMGMINLNDMLGKAMGAEQRDGK